MSADQLDLATAQIVNAPDVKLWPATAAITALSFGTEGQTRVEFTKKNGPGRWPDVTTAGWDGPLQYTLWLFVKDGPQWVGSGFIQFWHDRDGSGSAADPDVPSVYDQHWYYAPRWAPIFGHGPIQPGEKIGFMVTSGNARDSVGPYGPQERSNVVVIPATDDGAFTFTGEPVPDDGGGTGGGGTTPDGDLVPLLAHFEQLLIAHDKQAQARDEQLATQIAALKTSVTGLTFEGDVIVPYLGKGKITLKPVQS